MPQGAEQKEMLKRAGHIVLMILLVTSTGGVTIFRHYCGETLTKTTIDHRGSCCSHPCDRCHDRAVTYQVKDTFMPAVRSSVPPSQGMDLFLQPLPVLVSHTLSSPADLEKSAGAHAPPGPLSTGSRVALLQVFLT
jgi:hypothetical protein